MLELSFLGLNKDINYHFLGAGFKLHEMGDFREF
jgi:hypothetical protein